MVTRPFVLGVAASLAISASVTARPSIGPDVIVGDVSEVLRWGSVGTQTGYSLGLIACNIGNTLMMWQVATNQHPVIASSIYRLKTVDGSARMEQLGFSWLKHAFHSIADSLCGTCDGHSGQVLGAGCADPYSAALNGSQTTLGPRSEVNPYTGQFNFPFTLGWNQQGNVCYKRIPIENSDLDPALNAGALYFGEGLYVAADDAAAGNANNNSSWRRLVVQSPSAGVYNFGLASTTRQQRTAIQAWNEIDSQVAITMVDVPNDGRLVLGARVTNLGNGRWHYEYALQNLNCNRAARFFKSTFGSAAIVTNPGFRAPPCHSGEVFDNTAWSMATTGGLVWSTQTFAQNPNASALRWGTMYNFRFDADYPPKAGTLEIGLFGPGAVGDPASMFVSGPVPDAPDAPGGACPGDSNGDQQCNGSDLSVLLSNFAHAVTPGSGADFNSDGLVNGSDLSILLSVFGDTCP